MKISPVGLNYGITRRIQPQKTVNSQINFNGKYTATKTFGGIFGALGTLGAIGGTIIMTGGIALPFVLGYGALSAGSGAIIGHIIDKGNEEYDKENDK